VSAPHTAALAAFAGARNDQVPFELGQPTKHRQDQIAPNFSSPRSIDWSHYECFPRKRMAD
jgi:hypothetical protein